MFFTWKTLRVLVSAAVWFAWSFFLSTALGSIRDWVLEGEDERDRAIADVVVLLLLTFLAVFLSQLSVTHSFSGPIEHAVAKTIPGYVSRAEGSPSVYYTPKSHYNYPTSATTASRVGTSARY